MKKIIAISIIASGMLFAGTVDLGVTQENAIEGIATVSNHGTIEQGEIAVLGNSTVNQGSTVNQINKLEGTAKVVGDSSIQQGSVTISNSGVTLNKGGNGAGNSEENKIGNNIDVENNSTITQGELVVNSVATASITTTLDNEIGDDVKVNEYSKINQAKIDLGGGTGTNDGYLNKITLTAKETNKVHAGSTITDHSAINQGGIKMCGNDALTPCGS